MSGGIIMSELKEETEWEKNLRVRISDGLLRVQCSENHNDVDWVMGLVKNQIHEMCIHVYLSDGSSKGTTFNIIREECLKRGIEFYRMPGCDGIGGVQ